MKRIGLVCAVAIIVSTSLSGGWTRVAATPQETHGKKHEFGVMQYEAFHDVLHPLQHDALAAKDFRRIRGNSALLVKRGSAIVRLGVPRGVTNANKAEFGKELSKFRITVARFGVSARKGTDAELEAAFSAMHDSFEMIAAMLPGR